MDAERVAVGVGVAASVALLALLAVPYLVGSPATVGAYYAVGLAGPWVVALFAGVEIIVLLAGSRRRTDPATAAGIAVVVGLFTVAIAVEWALAVEPALVGGFTAVDSFRHHRWAVSVAAACVVAAAAGYARVVL